MKALSVAEVAAAMGKSEQWVRKLCAEGKLEAVKIGKRTWIIKGDENVYSTQTRDDDKT